MLRGQPLRKSSSCEESAPFSSVIFAAIHSPDLGSIAACTFIQRLRFSLPCLYVFHSHSPYTLSPDASITISKGLREESLGKRLLISLPRLQNRV